MTDTDKLNTDNLKVALPLYQLLNALRVLEGDEFCEFRDAIILGVYEAMVEGAKLVSYEVSPLGQKIKDVRF